MPYNECMPSPSATNPSRTATKGWLICLFVIWIAALLPRVGWTVYRWSAAPGATGLVFPDEKDYWTAAQSLADGTGLVDADGRRATRMPLYPALLCPFTHWSHGAWMARILQAMLGALTAPLIAWLAQRLAGRRTAWIAGLLAALDPFSVYFSSLLLTETLTTTALAGLWVVSWPLMRPDGRLRIWRWPVAGGLFLVLIYLHPSMIALVAAWVLLVTISARPADNNFAGLTTVVLMVLIGLAPWCWRNYELLGDPIVLTSRSGISLYDGQGPRADGSSNLAFTRDMPEHALPEPQWNRAYRDLAFESMGQDPRRAIRLAGIKLQRMWSPFPHASEAQSRTIRTLSSTWTTGLYVCMVVGLWFWRRRLSTCLTLLLPAACLSGVYMLFVGSIRYRLPFMPLLELMSAVGVARLLSLFRSSWRPTLPPEAIYVEDHPLTWPLHRWFPSLRYERHPVPLWRRRLALAMLLMLALGYYAYQYFTSDERIRQQAVSFLTHFTGGDIRIGQAQFRFFGGVALRDVTIALPGHIDFDPTARTIEDRQVFTAQNLQLRHEPFSLLTGRLRVAEIVADHPTVTLVKNADHPRYTYNWQTLFPTRPTTRKGKEQRLPSICIRNACVRIIEIRDRSRQAEPEIELSAMAMPDPHRSNTYIVPWRKLGDQPEHGRLFYRTSAGSYSGELPTLPLTTLRASLPQRYTDWLGTLELGGQITPEHVHYDARHGSRATVRLNGIQLSVPMHKDEQPTAQAAGRFIRLTDVRGQLVMTPTESSAEITGKLNGAPCQVTATVTQYAGPLDDVGFDIHLRSQGVRLPDPNDPAGKRFIERIPKVRSFFNDFDPHGTVDVDMHLFKSPGRDMGVLMWGTMTALDCDASYKNFPYRCRNVQGTVRFTKDAILLENLYAQHGTGRIWINGRVEGSNWYDGFDLAIIADNAPLDIDLFQAVPEKIRAIWDRFDPIGLAHMDIRLQRGAGSAEKGAGEWKTHIRADLAETRARFVDFPYAVDHLSGVLLIDDNQITVQRLTGSHGGASVRFDGQALYGGDQDTEVEFRLEAHGVAMDGDLASALPPDGQEAFDQYRPSGRTNLLGRVYLPRGGKQMSYHVAAHLLDGTICHQSLPCRIEGVRGTLIFTPETIRMVGVTGRRNDSPLSASGLIERRQEGYLTDVTIACDRLELDTTIRDALPDDMRKSWNAMSPTGRVNLVTHVRRAGSANKRIGTHETTLEALGNSICYEGLPLKLEDVRGRIRVTDEEAELIDLKARHKTGTILLSGRLPLAGDDRTFRLRLKADGMPFSDELRRALPQRLRETWNELRPTGTFNLNLDELTCRVNPSQPTAWAYRGQLELSGASLDVGFQATQIEGRLIGSGTARSDGSGMTLDASLDVKHIAINDRVLTELIGRMWREKGSDTLRLDDLTARAYGGQAAGFGRVLFGPEQTDYAVYLLAQDMTLGPFLSAGRPKDSPPTTATGFIDGRLFLTGTSGRVESRRGSGEVHIRQAQMYKLPFVLAMLTAINMTIPDDNAFHDARMRFDIEGNLLKFNTIQLQGKSLSMLGSGSMDTENEQLNLTFITGSPHALPRIPLLTELAQGASRELMEISITGPLSKPTMQGRSLYSLRMTLDALFPPRKKPPVAP